MLGHIKTIAVLLMGYFFFDSAINMRTAIGGVLAVCGMIIYGSTVTHGARDVTKENPESG